MTRSIRIVVGSVGALLVLGLASLLAIVGMSAWLNQRAHDHFDEVIRLRDMRGQVVEFRNAVQSAEAAQRGFLLLGNEIYLSPYSTARTLANRRLESLGEVANEAQIRPIVERIVHLTREKFAEMDRTIALKGDRQDDEAVAILRTNRGKMLMDEINLMTSGIVRSADERLTVGVDELRSNSSKLRMISLAAAGLIVLVVVGVVVTISLYARDIARARDEVIATNASLETRVQERTADLARLNAEIQRFAHVVSHDLRAPLVNIVGFTGELELALETVRADVSRRASDAAVDDLSRRARSAVAGEIPEAIGFIRSSTQKMDKLLAAILKLSRDGMRTLQPTRIDLAELIDATRSALQHQLTAASAEIRTDLRVPAIVSDRLALEQVLGNLIDNSVKYRAPDRPLRIEIRSRPDGERAVLIAIADNGRGIATKDLERIFDLFGRVGVRDQPGEGVGLAHVRTLVRTLGGDISVASELGIGTCFTLRLPVALSA